MNVDRLATKITTGDKEAFEALYEKMRGLVFAVCLSVTKNRGIAEELTQETFVAVWQKSGQFRGVGYKAWILTIAKNKSLNALRKSAWETAVDFSENEYLCGGYEMHVETGIALKTALSALSATEREIVLLRNAGMKAKEIAAFMRLPRGTVSWHYARALKRLKELLEDEE